MAKRQKLRNVIDILMTALLLFLMAYQITGEMLHEWIGMAMTLLVIAHQILNRKWYAALFKGKYSVYRGVSAALNVLLLLSFAFTAFCGMAMSNYATPFLYGIAKISFVRKMHLSMSHYSFVLMGLHIGMHVPVMLQGLKERQKTIICLLGCLLAAIGLRLFLKNGCFDYIFFREAFAFLDYDKSALLVFLENILMLLFWVFAGSQCALLLRKTPQKKEKLFPAALLLASVLFGCLLFVLLA